MKNSTQLLKTALLVALLLCGGIGAQPRPGQAARTFRALHEVNQVARPDANHVVAIVGATLIVGRDGPPVLDAFGVVRGERIVAVGTRASVSIPAGADVVDAKGLT